MKIKLRPFQQEKRSTCLPACLRIVLDYFGRQISEKELAEACRVNQKGAKLKDAAQAMRSRSFDVIEMMDADLFDLFDHLNQDKPVIVAIDVEQIPYEATGMHAVVISGLEKNRVHFIDPALGKSISLDLITFFKAWDSCGCSGLVVFPKLKTKTRKKKK